MQWLESLGVEFPADRLSTPNGRGTPRSHEPIGFGMKITEYLDTALSQTSVDLACKSRVEKMRTDAEGAVTGVVVGGEHVGCRSVVIATGGYGGSTEMDQATAAEGHAASATGSGTSATATNRGDGLTMAEQVGAAICWRRTADCC